MSSKKDKRPSLSSFPGISAHDLRRVAVEATCDPRVVVKYLRRMPQPSTMRARIEQALVRCGLGHFVAGAAPLAKAPSPPLAAVPTPPITPSAARTGSR